MDSCHIDQMKRFQVNFGGFSISDLGQKNEFYEKIYSEEVTWIQWNASKFSLQSLKNERSLFSLEKVKKKITDLFVKYLLMFP